MTREQFTISEEQKKQYAGLYLLDYMVTESHTFPLLLEEDDTDLEPVLEWLLTKDYIGIIDNERYEQTVNGKAALSLFMTRYKEFLKTFDIFSAVDLETGEFAFASCDEFKNETEWRNFLNNEQWDDLRVAVADYRDMDPVEVVFMSFINENRFGRNETGWQFDLLLGTVWDEILEIADTAIRWQELGWEDEQGSVRAEDVIKDIINQGTEIMNRIHEQDD